MTEQKNTQHINLTQEEMDKIDEKVSKWDPCKIKDEDTPSDMFRKIAFLQAGGMKLTKKRILTKKMVEEEISQFKGKSKDDFRFWNSNNAPLDKVHNLFFSICNSFSYFTCFEIWGKERKFNVSIDKPVEFYEALSDEDKEQVIVWMNKKDSENV